MICVLQYGTVDNFTVCLGLRPTATTHTQVSKSVKLGVHTVVVTYIG